MLNNAFVAVGVALLVLGIGEKMLTIVTGVVMLLVGLGALIFK